MNDVESCDETDVSEYTPSHASDDSSLESDEDDVDIGIQPVGHGCKRKRQPRQQGRQSVGPRAGSGNAGDRDDPSSTTAGSKGAGARNPSTPGTSASAVAGSTAATAAPTRAQATSSSAHRVIVKHVTTQPRLFTSTLIANADDRQNYVRNVIYVCDDKFDAQKDAEDLETTVEERRAQATCNSARPPNESDDENFVVFNWRATERMRKMDELVKNAKASIDNEDGSTTVTRERWHAIHHFFSTSIKEGIEQRVPSAAAATAEKLREFGALVTTNATPSTLTVVNSPHIDVTPRGKWDVRQHQQVRELLQAAVDFLVSLGAKAPEAKSHVSTVNGEHTLASVTVMLDLVVHILVKVLKKKIENCSFADIGSGGGKVLLHALAQYPFAKAHGFEYVRNRVEVSRLLLDACHEMNQTRSALYLPKEKFGVRCLDVSEVTDWPYDVVYMFDAVYGDAVLDRLACAFNRSSIQLFLTFHTHADWESRGLVHFVHVGTVHCENMYSSACHDDTANTERLTRKDLHKTAYILMRSPNARRPPDVWCAAPIDGRCKIVNTIYGLKDDEVQIMTVDSMGITLVTKRYNLHFPGCAQQHVTRDDKMCPFFNEPGFTYEREDEREARHNQERASATAEAAAAADEAPAAQAVDQAAAGLAAAEQAAAEPTAAGQAATGLAAADQATTEPTAAEQATTQQAAAQAAEAAAAHTAAEAAAAQTAAEAAAAQTVADQAAAEQMAASAATQAIVLYEPDEAETAAAAAASEAAAVARADMARVRREARRNIRKFGRGEGDAGEGDAGEGDADSDDGAATEQSFFVAKSFVNRDKGTLYRSARDIATRKNAHAFVRNSILTGVGPKLQDGDDIYSLSVALRRVEDLMGSKSAYRDMMTLLSLFVCGESVRLAEAALAPYFRDHDARNYGMLEWLEQLRYISKEFQAAARGSVASRRGRTIKADPGARSAWIVVAKFLLEGTDSAGSPISRNFYASYLYVCNLDSSF